MKRSARARIVSRVVRAPRVPLSSIVTELTSHRSLNRFHSLFFISPLVTVETLNSPRVKNRVFHPAFRMIPISIARYRPKCHIFLHTVKDFSSVRCRAVAIIDSCLHTVRSTLSGRKKRYLTTRRQLTRTKLRICIFYDEKNCSLNGRLNGYIIDLNGRRSCSYKLEFSKNGT